jgi:hypothetical protein
MSEIEPNAAGPEPEDEEKDASLKRREEEDAQRYPGHEDPEKATEPGSDGDS